MKRDIGDMTMNELVAANSRDEQGKRDLARVSSIRQRTLMRDVYSGRPLHAGDKPVLVMHEDIKALLRIIDRMGGARG